MGDEGAVVEFGEVGRRDARLITVTDAPDAAAGFVAVGVRARDFVVRNDFVIPIDDVERAVGAEMHRDRAEPLVVGREKIGEPLVTVARPVGRGARGVDFVREGIGEEEDLCARVAGGRAKRAEESVAILGEREAAESGGAHQLAAERRRHEGLVGTEQLARTGAHMNAKRIGDHRVAEIIRLLEERLALAAREQAPDVVRPGGEILKAGAVERKGGEFALIENNLRGTVRKRSATGATDRRIVKQTLRHKDLPAGLAEKLVGKEVGVLRAETGEDNVVTVGAAVGIGVAVEADIGAVLDEGTVFVRLHAEGHDETVGEDAGWSGDGGAAGRGRGVRIIEYDDLVAAAGGEERVGRGFLFVAVDRVFERGHRPHPHTGVPRKADEFAETGGLGDDEFGDEAGWKREREALLLG